MSMFGGTEATLQAALRAGQGQARQTQFNEGQLLVQQAVARQAQQAALKLEQNKVDLQAQQLRLGLNSSTGRSRNTPFTRSASQANASFKTPNALGLDEATREALAIAERSGDRDTVNSILTEARSRNTRRSIGTPGTGEVGGGNTQFEIDEHGNFTGTQNNRDLSSQQIRQRGGFVGAGQQETRTPLQMTKQNLLDGFPNISDQARQAATAFLTDESMDLNTFAIRLNQLKKGSGGGGGTQEIASQRSFIREQVKDVDRTIKAIEEELDIQGIKTLGRGTEDLLQQAERAATSGTSFLGLRGGNLDAEKQEEIRNLIFALQQAKVERGQFRSQEQSLIAGQVPAAAPAQQQQQQDLSGLSFEQLIQELGQ